MKPSLRRELALAAAVILGAVAVVSFAPPPDATRLSGASHDFAHVIVFGVLGLVLARALRRLPARRPGWPLVALVTLLAGLGFGIATEYAQGQLGGMPSWGDVGRDVLGAALGLCAAIALEYPTARGARRLLWVTVVAGGLAAAVPLANSVLDYRARAAAFPVLVDANATRGTAFVSGLEENVTLETPPPQIAAAASGRALRVALDRGPWPGVALTEPSPDWRGWRALVVEVANPGTRPLTLVVRVNDRAHDNRHEDRFNSDRILPPRARARLEFPLAAIERAPTGRRMDLATIDKIVVFHPGPAPGQQFYLERMTLVR